MGKPIQRPSPCLPPPVCRLVTSASPPSPRTQRRSPLRAAPSRRSSTTLPSTSCTVSASSRSLRSSLPWPRPLVPRCRSPWPAISATRWLVVASSALTPRARRASSSNPSRRSRSFRQRACRRRWTICRRPLRLTASSARQPCLRSVALSRWAGRSRTSARRTLRSMPLVSASPPTSRCVWTRNVVWSTQMQRQRFPRQSAQPA